MAAINDITQDKIQTSALSKQGRDNFDDIFAKRTIVEWSKIEGINFIFNKINEGKKFSYSEFLKIKNEL